MEEHVDKIPSEVQLLKDLMAEDQVDKIILDLYVAEQQIEKCHFSESIK